MQNNDNSPLAQDNLGLVHLCANKFRNRGIEYDELYSAGCMGLVKASRSFDSERGVRFSTYAVPVILGEIKRLFRDGGTVKVSRSLKELSLRVTAARESFIRDEGREPRISELSQKLGEDESLVTEALNVSLPVLSLTPVTDNEDDKQTDIPVDAHDTEIIDKLSLRQAITELDNDDRKLIYYRYYENKTQTETATLLGMTQVQVSRREKKLLLSMRKKLIV
jgi:RNA polymerase sporulation-specific sigma factor